MGFPKDVWWDYLIVFGPTAIFCLILASIAFLLYLEVIRIVW
ncbi:MAG TPA: hypothetical protein VK463_14515 [Desulfomonilaceae bacterium]|nr:hypothetical protein [Desulfomonilaceae bacterium]